VGLRSIRVDTGLGSLPIQSPVSYTYATISDHLAHLYRPFLDIEVDTHRGGLRHIWVLSLCKCIPDSPDGMHSKRHFRLGTILLTLCQADSRVSRIFIIPIVLFHVVVAFLFKVMFFSYYVVRIGAPEPIPSDPGPIDTPAAMFF